MAAVATIADVFAKTRFNPVRAPVNPLDKHTIVSVYCKPVPAVKCTITPGYFYVPAAKDDDIALLVVGTSSWFKEIDPEQPPVEIPVPSGTVANSIIDDFCNGLVGCNMNDKMPGFFKVPGPANMVQATEFKDSDYALLKATIKKEFAAEINAARIRQKAWFEELIQIADVSWARTNGNPLSVSDDSRLAAEKLGRKNKPWMQDFVSYAMVACPACGALRNEAFPICGSCKTVVDPKKFAELGLQVAK